MYSVMASPGETEISIFGERLFSRFQTISMAAGMIDESLVILEELGAGPSEKEAANEAADAGQQIRPRHLVSGECEQCARELVEAG